MKKILLVVALFLAPVFAQAVTPVQIYPARITRTGITNTATTVDTTNGHSCLLYGGEFLRLYNGGAGSTANLTVTASDQHTNVEGYTTNAVVYLQPGQVKYMGPFVKWRWADTSGLLQITVAGNAAGTIEIFRLPFGEPEIQTK